MATCLEDWDFPKNNVTHQSVVLMSLLKLLYCIYCPNVFTLKKKRQTGSQLLLFLGDSFGKHFTFLCAGSLGGSLIFWMYSPGSCPIGMQFGRQLEFDFSQHHVLCNPWNLGTGVRDKTSPREKFRDHAGFTGFVLSVLPPETGNQQEIKPSISAFSVMNPFPSTLDGSRWATHPGSPYNPC